MKTILSFILVASLMLASLTVTATSPVTSPRVVYASELGAALNSNLATGGGTDDTLVLQTFLNSVSTLGSVTLFIDGVSLISGLTVPSNVTIKSFDDGSGGFYLKTGSNRAAIRNANRTAGAVIDRNIALKNLTINGNRAGQAKCNGSCTTGGEYNVGLQFFGVVNLRLENVHVFNSKNFGVHGANLHNASFLNTWIEQPDFEVDNHDGIHINGPSSNISIAGTCVQRPRMTVSRSALSTQ